MRRSLSSSSAWNQREKGDASYLHDCLMNDIPVLTSRGHRVPTTKTDYLIPSFEKSITDKDQQQIEFISRLPEAPLLTRAWSDRRVYARKHNRLWKAEIFPTLFEENSLSAMVESSDSVSSLQTNDTSQTTNIKYDSYEITETENGDLPYRQFCAHLAAWVSEPNLGISKMANDNVETLCHQRIQLVYALQRITAHHALLEKQLRSSEQCYRRIEGFVEPYTLPDGASQNSPARKSDINQALNIVYGEIKNALHELDQNKKQSTLYWSKVCEEKETLTDSLKQETRGQHMSIILPIQAYAEEIAELKQQLQRARSDAEDWEEQCKRNADIVAANELKHKRTKEQWKKREEEYQSKITALQERISSTRKTHQPNDTKIRPRKESLNYHKRNQISSIPQDESKNLNLIIMERDKEIAQLRTRISDQQKLLDDVRFEVISVQAELHSTRGQSIRYRAQAGHVYKQVHDEEKMAKLPQAQKYEVIIDQLQQEVQAQNEKTAACENQINELKTKYQKAKSDAEDWEEECRRISGVIAATELKFKHAKNQWKKREEELCAHYAMDDFSFLEPHIVAEREAEISGLKKHLEAKDKELQSIVALQSSNDAFSRALAQRDDELEQLHKALDMSREADTQLCAVLQEENNILKRAINEQKEMMTAMEEEGKKLREALQDEKTTLMRSVIEKEKEMFRLRMLVETQKEELESGEKQQNVQLLQQKDSYISNHLPKECEAEKENLKKENAEMKVAVIDLGKQVADLRSELENKSADARTLTALRNEKAALTHTIAKRDEELLQLRVTLEAEKEEVAQKYAELNEQKSDLKQELIERDNTMLQLRDLIKELKDKEKKSMADYLKQKDDLTRTIEEREEKISQLSSGYDLQKEEAKKSYNVYQNEKVDLMHTISEKEDELIRLRKMLDIQEEELKMQAMLQDERDALIRDIADKDAELSRLQALIETQTMHESEAVSTLRHRNAELTQKLTEQEEASLQERIINEKQFKEKEREVILIQEELARLKQEVAKRDEQMSHLQQVLEKQGKEQGKAYQKTSSIESRVDEAIQEHARKLSIKRKEVAHRRDTVNSQEVALRETIVKQEAEIARLRQMLHSKSKELQLYMAKQNPEATMSHGAEGKGAKVSALRNTFEQMQTNKDIGKVTSSGQQQLQRVLENEIRKELGAAYQRDYSACQVKISREMRTMAGHIAELEAELEEFHRRQEQDCVRVARADEHRKSAEDELRQRRKDWEDKEKILKQTIEELKQRVAELEKETVRLYQKNLDLVHELGKWAP
ncbi:hypothetical protein EC973_008283 [Apophysomyces ossiformis]|uniref:Uncharacterized protein n=1 Tax=Apophysomyces ossiformis TaxID=679940 RepID=A0A8H7BVB4_9FUNG|nr:hypothetical protein EC973_008283 [Apophysomyces ossiformis]